MSQLQAEPIRYIGITGFMTRRGVEIALSFMPKSTKLKLMVGVLASSKTLSGKINRYPNRYPNVENIANIFTDDPRALNLIHYGTDNQEDVVPELERLVGLGGQNLHGFQLNMTWPDREKLVYFKSKHPDKYLVLQIGGKAMVVIDGYQDLRYRIQNYYDPQGDKIIDAILLDPSGGKGVSFNPDKERKRLSNLQEFKFLGKGVAGGLGGPDTNRLLSGLGYFAKGISVDAEGNLRTSDGHDALDMDKVREYLKNAYSRLE